ncbi:energy-coupling factor ABC transporter ATP-binding protein [Natranaerobius trueperi]|nr:ABC transporter ATP-binding protein [Natranaerobius trueperi]
MTLYYLDNVNYSYDGQKLALSVVDLAISDTGLTAVIGDNGSGKTTLGKLLAGILKPTFGRVLLQGQDTKEMTLGEIGNRIGYLFQEPERQIFAPTVEEELSFVLKVKGFTKEKINDMVDEMLTRFHLEHLRKNFPFYLSRGEKQRLALATVLIDKPRFIILDEPTTALDIKRKAELSNILKELLDENIGMMIISHDYQFVTKHATRVIEIDGGVISHDSCNPKERANEPV